MQWFWLFSTELQKVASGSKLFFGKKNSKKVDGAPKSPGFKRAPMPNVSGPKLQVPVAVEAPKPGSIPKIANARLRAAKKLLQMGKKSLGFKKKRSLFKPKKKSIGARLSAKEKKIRATKAGIAIPVALGAYGIHLQGKADRAQQRAQQPQYQAQPQMQYDDF